MTGALGAYIMLLSTSCNIYHKNKITETICYHQNKKIKKKRKKNNLPEALTRTNYRCGKTNQYRDCGKLDERHVWNIFDYNFYSRYIKTKIVN